MGLYCDLTCTRLIGEFLTLDELLSAHDLAGPAPAQRRQPAKCRCLQPRLLEAPLGLAGAHGQERMPAAAPGQDTGDLLAM